nr:type I glutamate--ammonia ligase [Desulfitobacterium hafniense]
KRGSSTRVELRSPDPSCNPYLALAVQLKAGLDGIKNKLIPPSSVDLNIYEMNIEERKQLGIESLPGNLMEALEELKRDNVIRDALGEHIYNRFIEAKSKEWNRYNMTVHQWEINQYLEMY